MERGEFEAISTPGHCNGHFSLLLDGRERSYDNPLILANRKAKRLASVLRKQSSVVRSRIRLPWVEPLIFLSATSLSCRLSGTAAARVYLRGQPGSAEDPGCAC